MAPNPVPVSVTCAAGARRSRRRRNVRDRRRAPVLLGQQDVVDVGALGGGARVGDEREADPHLRLAEKLVPSKLPTSIGLVKPAPER